MEQINKPVSEKVGDAFASKYFGTSSYEILKDVSKEVRVMTGEFESALAIHDIFRTRETMIALGACYSEMLLMCKNDEERKLLLDYVESFSNYGGIASSICSSFKKITQEDANVFIKTDTVYKLKRKMKSSPSSVMENSNLENKRVLEKKLIDDAQYFSENLKKLFISYEFEFNNLNTEQMRFYRSKFKQALTELSAYQTVLSVEIYNKIETILNNNIDELSKRVDFQENINGSIKF